MEFSVEGSVGSVSEGKPRVGLAWQIVCGLLSGIVAGLALNRYPALRADAVANFLQPAGDTFIKLIRMLVVPIVFTNIANPFSQHSRASLKRSTGSRPSSCTTRPSVSTPCWTRSASTASSGFHRCIAIVRQTSTISSMSLKQCP